VLKRGKLPAARPAGRFFLSPEKSKGKNADSYRYYEIMAMMNKFRRFYRLFFVFFLMSAGFGGPVPGRAQEGPEVFYPPGMDPPEGTASSPAGLRSPGTADSGAAAAADPGAAAPAEQAPPGEGTTELPRSYRGITLGMSLADLKSALQRDPLLDFRGDRDVSFLPVSAQSQNLVETTGPSFIRRAFFQLREGELFIMGFALHAGLVDHYSIFTGLVKKYGAPAYLDPKQAVWEAGDTRIALERPLTVKYIDRKIFNELMGESALKESAETKRRQEFLDDF
jgi:hypothetical protein